MEGKAVDSIERIIKDGLTVTNEEGQTFSAHQMNVMVYDPAPATIKLATLLGLADFVKSKQGKSLVKETSIAVVDGHNRVRILSEPSKKTRTREHTATAEYSFCGFSFGNFMSVEEFIIGCQAGFQVTPDLQDILSYVGKMTLTDEIGVEDDGVSQKVRVQRGVSGGVTDPATLPSKVVLTPFRTFPEVEQPTSEFIFRVKAVGETIKVALIEADGGAWKNQAAVNIEEWLRSMDIGIPVIR